MIETGPVGALVGLDAGLAAATGLAAADDDDAGCGVGGVAVPAHPATSRTTNMGAQVRFIDVLLRWRGTCRRRPVAWVPRCGSKDRRTTTRTEKARSHGQ